jgi:hypothetical protein
MTVAARIGSLTFANAAAVCEAIRAATVMERLLRVQYGQPGKPAATRRESLPVLCRRASTRGPAIGSREGAREQIRRVIIDQNCLPALRQQKSKCFAVRSWAPAHKFF